MLTYNSLLNKNRISSGGGGEGRGDSLIKAGTDVRRVQNLGRKNFPKKPNARAKSAQKPNDRESFHEL